MVALSDFEKKVVDELGVTVAFADARVRATKLRGLENKIAGIVDFALSLNELHEDRDIEREMERAMDALESVKRMVHERAGEAEAKSFLILRGWEDV